MIRNFLQKALCGNRHKADRTVIVNDSTNPAAQHFRLEAAKLRGKLNNALAEHHRFRINDGLALRYIRIVREQGKGMNRLVRKNKRLKARIAELEAELRKLDTNGNTT